PASHLPRSTCYRPPPVRDHGHTMGGDMRLSRARWLAVLLAFGLLAAACGDDRDDEGTATTTTAAGGGDTTAPPDDTTDGDDGEPTETTEAPEGETFGDLTWPCGPGDGEGNTASDTGVTEDT